MIYNVSKCSAKPFKLNIFREQCRVLLQHIIHPGRVAWKLKFLDRISYFDVFIAIMIAV